MFCKQCGSQIDDNASFCSNCGQPVTGKAAMENTSVAENNNHIQAVGDVAVDTDTIRGINGIVQEAFRFANMSLEKHDHANKIRTSNAGVVWGIILPCFGFLFFVAGGIAEQSWEMVIVGLFIMGIGVLILIATVNSHKKVNNQKQALHAEADSDANKAYDIMYDNAENLSYIPSKYWTPDCTAFMLEMCYNGRVATKNQLFDKCDEFLHRRKLEEAAERQYEAQMQTFMAVNAAAGSARAAAGAANAAAIAGWLSLLR